MILSKKAKRRAQLLKEQNGLCYYCDEPLTVSTSTIDHKKPISKGGSVDAKENQCAACTRCNSIKANFETLADVEEWYKITKAFFERIEKQKSKHVALYPEYKPVSRLEQEKRFLGITW